MVSYKMNAPAYELFFRAVLCNWLICLAFFIPMAQHGDGPKLFTMVLFVFCFFISGYEHSIANMCTFAIALVLDHPGTISLRGVIHNLIPVTLGNLVGGGLLWVHCMLILIKSPRASKKEIRKFYDSRIFCKTSPITTASGRRFF